MKRRALIHRIRSAAAERGIRYRLNRQGSQHEIWEVGGLSFAVPRHRDISERTAEAIMRELESIFGEGWWRP
ncbi:MAG: hypothetical protein AABM41_00295 [Chloroflexota bacterium]